MENLPNISIVDTKGYKCNECGKIYIDKLQAELCHKKYFCEVCGKPTPMYMLLCDSCANERRYKNADKITYKEYIEKYPDFPIYGLDDEYYTDLDDMVSMYKSNGLELPKYVYGCTKDRIELDAEDILMNYEENVNIEDFQLDGREELDQFINDWNKQFGVDVYYSDLKTIILLDEEDLK